MILSCVSNGYYYYICPLPPGRPISSSGESSGRSSPNMVEERAEETLAEDDEILQQTTAVVKSVMELSNKVPLSRPNDYVELVKVCIVSVHPP